MTPHSRRGQRSRGAAGILVVIGLAAAALAAAGPPAAASPAQAKPQVAPGLSVDALTTTWQDNSLAGSTGSPQPQPTTTADCGVWSGGDGTQVVALNNGDNLWTFGDTEIGPAVARQDFFNNSFIRNSMVRQSGSTFTTITGGSGCPATTAAQTPVVPPSASTTGYHDWPASSITYGSDLVKFYYAADGLTQEAPQVVELPQSDFESGGTISVTSTQLDGCLASPIMWGAATVSATTGGTAYTYIYGNQTATGALFLARTSGDPSDQPAWQYYTGAGSFSAVPSGDTCGDLPLAQLGGLKVSTEFSVTTVAGQYWLVQEDPVGGNFPDWAAVHVAGQPWTFSDSASDATALFSLSDTPLAATQDNYPGFTAYAVRMLEPAAVTASTPGDVVIAYNVNDTTELDAGCVPLIDYDANVYVPRFIDVPVADVTGKAAAARAAGLPAARVGPASDSSSTWTYSPDTVPDVSWQSSSCPSSDSSYYQPVDPNITVTSNPDGSLDLSWPNQGPDVWYWIHWEDVTSAPGTWNEDPLWSAGPNADGWQTLPAAGLTPSDTSTIRLHFVPTGNSGDAYSFSVQAFAAGNSQLTSADSAATATAPVAAQVPAPAG
jgi:hypothetical protein